MLSHLSAQGVTAATVIDVGANIGQFAVAASHFLAPKRLYSFEPEPDTFDRLARNLAQIADTKAINKALGDVPGLLPLHRNSHRHSSSLLRLGEAHRRAFPGAIEDGEIQVEVSTLDAELSREPLEGPVLLKLDVQGYEDKVLAGAAESLKRVDWLIMEVSFRPLYDGETVFMDLLPKMTERGFEFVRPVGWLASPNNGEILQMDALFRRHGFQ